MLGQHSCVLMKERKRKKEERKTKERKKLKEKKYYKCSRCKNLSKKMSSFLMQDFVGKDEAGFNDIAEQNSDGKRIS